MNLSRHYVYSCVLWQLMTGTVRYEITINNRIIVMRRPGVYRLERIKDLEQSDVHNSEDINASLSSGGYSFN